MRKELLSTTIIRHSCLLLDWQLNVSIYKCVSHSFARSLARTHTSVWYLFSSRTAAREQRTKKNAQNKTSSALDVSAKFRRTESKLVMKWVMSLTWKTRIEDRTKWTPLINSKKPNNRTTLEIQVGTHGPMVSISHSFYVKRANKEWKCL